MPGLMDLIELRKYIPELLEAIGHGQVLVDDQASLEDRGEALVSLLDLAAQFTETEWDDELVDRLQRVTDCDDFWRALDVVIDCMRDDHDHDMNIGAKMEERGIDPATIVLIVQVVMQVIKFFRNR